MKPKINIIILLTLFISPIDLLANNWGKKVVSAIDNLCKINVHKTPNGTTSPLMSQIKAATKKSYKVPSKYGNVNLSTLMYPELNWRRGDIQLDVYRGGHEIFSAMSELIKSAEKEVLIQTFIFDFNSRAAQDYIFKAILQLYNKHKKRMNEGEVKEPIYVRLVFDVIGSMKGINLNELFINTRFVHKGEEGEGKIVAFGKGLIKRIKQIGKKRSSYGEDEDYEIMFPKSPKLDPKYMRFELKAHRHRVAKLRAVTHSKTVVVDRQRAFVTGANIIDYHLTNEYKVQRGEELMIDHGFYVFGEGALMAANDFYNLWYKEGKAYQKISGVTTQYNGNVKADEGLIFNGNHFKDVSPAKNFVFIRSNIPKNKRSIAKNVLMGIVGRKATAETKRYGSTPQNDAFMAIFRNAKNHINITSPNLNSENLMSEIVSAVSRGVNVNFLLSKNYQDYNRIFQEGGTNQDAVIEVKKRIQNLKQKDRNGGKGFGKFNLRWFATRSGNLSGKQQGQAYKGLTMVSEKFWNHNHTKFLSADNQVVIVGSANFDEQSWYNSREFNLAIDDHAVASYWCRKVFGVDFMRAHPFENKVVAGDSCLDDSDCNQKMGLYCKVPFLWHTGTCYYKKRMGPNGAICNSNNQCKSNKCNKEQRCEN